MKYYKLYLYKAGGPVVDTVSAFGLYCATIPFQMCGEAKELTSHDWCDEDGLDEYVPTELKMKSYEMDVKLCYKGGRGSANHALRSFLDYVTGRDGGGCELSMYCEWTKIGRSGVRFVKMSDDAELVRDGDGDILVVTFTFLVTEPMKDVTLSIEDIHEK